MQHFYAIVHKDEDSAFGIEFPDLPGCYSAADELEDVPAKAREALSLWFEDQDAAQPRALADIRVEAAEALAAGAFLIAVPHIARSGRVVRVNVSIDEGLLSAIDHAARQRRQTRSAFLSDAATETLQTA